MIDIILTVVGMVLFGIIVWAFLPDTNTGTPKMAHPKKPNPFARPCPNCNTPTEPDVLAD